MVGETFGITNSIITILGLITGLYATKVNKIGIIGAILALLLSDPLCDAYALYTSQKIIKKENAYKIGIRAFFSQLLLQILFLIIIIISPSIKKSIYICYIVGIILTIIYDKYNKVTIKDSIFNLLTILGLIIFTYYINTFIYKYFNNTL